MQTIFHFGLLSWVILVHSNSFCLQCDQVTLMLKPFQRSNSLIIGFSSALGVIHFSSCHIDDRKRKRHTNPPCLQLREPASAVNFEAGKCAQSTSALNRKNQAQCSPRPFFVYEALRLLEPDERLVWNCPSAWGKRTCSAQGDQNKGTRSATLLHLVHPWTKNLQLCWEVKFEASQKKTKKQWIWH